VRPADPHAAYWARWKFARLGIPLQERAHELGYALLVHGSLARDIDLVAVPWTTEAVSGEDLVRELEAKVRELDVSPPEEVQPTAGPHEKPHGRRAWTIFVQGTYFDLSIMPRAAPAP
jgi:hypothetical protein